MNKLHAALIRSARTTAQASVGFIGSAVVLSDVDWQVVVSGSLLAGLLSLLTSAATELPEAE